MGDEHGSGPMDDTEFLHRFEAQGFAHDEWHHRDHVRAAYLYLTQLDFDAAAAKMRDGIRALNASHGGEDSLTHGYHETLTMAWLHVIATMIAEYGPAASADEFLDSQPQLLTRNLLRLFYTRDRIMSAEAKARFVTPDLAPLPRKQQPARER